MYLYAVINVPSSKVYVLISKANLSHFNLNKSKMNIIIILSCLMRIHPREL